jgi:hypothetical protein|mmetsp:Transcript_15293/g.27188  ORF Transcript_15293/g.27188 Transcript_15293/m.27188 type:complete len:83 (+) Transcript_15293:417-665(+)
MHLTIFAQLHAQSAGGECLTTGDANQLQAFCIALSRQTQQFQNPKLRKGGTQRCAVNIYNLPHEDSNISKHVHRTFFYCEVQ